MGTEQIVDFFLDAVRLRVGWAKEALIRSEYTDLEKIWMRRYEMDVPPLVAEVERLREETEAWRTQFEEAAKLSHEFRNERDGLSAKDAH